MGKLRNSLSEYGVALHAVLSKSPVTIATSQTLGLATRVSQLQTRPANPRTARRGKHPGEEAVLIKRSLRSGTKIKYPGHIIVLGDVNRGAEVVAAGDIIIWGQLHGLVHAGSEGDEDAAVCALLMAPTQLLIAGQSANPGERKGDRKPEIAKLNGGRIVSWAWDIPET